MRDRKGQPLLKEPRDPATLMLSLIKEEAYRLSVNLITGRIVYKTLELDMMPARLALYAFFAMQTKNFLKESKTCGGWTDCFLEIQEVFEKQSEITRIYGQICGTRPIDEMSEGGITNLSAENFNMYKGKIKQDLLSRFGAYALKELEIASLGRRPNTRYGIKMDKNRIEIGFLTRMCG